MPSAEGATPTIVFAVAPPRAGGGGGWAALGCAGAGPGGPPNTGLGPVRRASSGWSTWNEVPHFGHLIFNPDAGTLRSSTW